MNYYKRHLGDYAKKCGRLSMLQHGAYTLLLDSCYDREQFPTIDDAIEWTWASTTDEIEAVTFVLRKFFVLENGLYVQKRVQEELAEYRAKSEINRRIAIERETNRKSKSTNRANTVNGSSPNHKPLTINQEPITKNQADQEIEQASSPPASPTAPPATCVVEHVPPIAKPKPREAAAGTRLPADWVLSQALGEWALTEGMTRDRIRQEADRFRDYWIAKPGAAGRKTDWPATWRNWVRRATETKTGGNNGQSGRPDRESVSARAVREAAEFIADLDAADRAERCQADGSGGIHENELALPWEGVGRL